jgi:glutamine amidotransferase
MKVAIVKYNAGNVLSVINALRRLGVEPKVTDDPMELSSADKVIFPGVGEASSAMRYLIGKGLDKVLVKLKQPFLGICLGLQLMCTYSEENNTSCMGIFDLKVKRFPPTNKVPHMGWNKIEMKEDPLFLNHRQNSFLYFVHSYYAEMGPDTIGISEYILSFSAALHKDNFYAIQAHPEKSGEDGKLILENFLKIR